MLTLQMKDSKMEKKKNKNKNKSSIDIPNKTNKITFSFFLLNYIGECNVQAKSHEYR